MNERSLFMEALEIEDVARRAAFLDKACGDDSALRRRIERLLQAATQAGSFLDKPALLDESPTLDAAGFTPSPDMHIGPYTLVQQIGEGGMGTVFLAHQHEPLRRSVALKVIKAGMDSRQVIARFEVERQALALMDHPNIARVLEAGTTETGQPYFVMELVKGVPITMYCDEQRLTLRQRLELFIPICQALQHAHQKGIIHRDLKPSNVLVAEYDGRPVPKVIDFGIAKATLQPLTEGTTLTGLGHLVGTLEYMSPEQAKFNALDIDTRSDVYALGVMLYELLTGNPPFNRKRLRETPLDESLRIIREEDPPRPSTGVDIDPSLPDIAAKRSIEPAKLAKLLRGDLEWIVMKALDKDRARRYETADGFAQDVQRYLADEPVSAGPPSTRYRLGKFVRRYRRGLAAAGAFALLLIAATALSVWLAVWAMLAEQETGKERDKALAAKERADEESAIAEAVSNFLRKDLLGNASSDNQGDANLKPDPNMSVRTLLDRAAQQITGKFDKQPRVEAAIRLTIGTTYRDLGLFAPAEEQLQKCIAVQRRFLNAEDHHLLRAITDLASLYHEFGKLDVAEPLYEECLAVRRRAFGEEHVTTLIIMNDLAVLYAHRGRFDQAVPLMEKVVEVRDRLIGEDDAETMMMKRNLAAFYSYVGKLDKAEELLQRCLEVRQRVSGPEHPYTLSVMSDLGNVYVKRRKLTDAVPLLEKSLAAQRKVSGEKHPLTLNAMALLAGAQRSLGQYEKAEALFRECLTGRTEVLGAEHPNTLATESDLADVYRDWRRFEDAERLYQKNLETCRRVLGPEHRITLIVLQDFANLYFNQGKYAKAESMFKTALEAQQKVSDKGSRDTVVPLNYLGNVYFQQDKLTQAAAHYAEALAIAQRFHDADDTGTLTLLSSLATVRRKQGQHAEAERLFGQVLASQRRLGNDTADVADTLARMSWCYLAQAKYTVAEEVCREALRIREKKLPGDWLVFESQSLLGVALGAQKRYAEAEPLLISGYEGLLARKDVIPATSAQSLSEALERIVQLYKDWGKKDKADEWRRRSATP
jgi:serine/threonine protein kinase/Tfp pilus assembly protein PilF